MLTLKSNSNGDVQQQIAMNNRAQQKTEAPADAPIAPSAQKEEERLRETPREG